MRLGRISELLCHTSTVPPLSPRNSGRLPSGGEPNPRGVESAPLGVEPHCKSEGAGFSGPYRLCRICSAFFGLRPERGARRRSSRRDAGKHRQTDRQTVKTSTDRQTCTAQRLWTNLHLPPVLFYSCQLEMPRKRVPSVITPPAPAALCWGRKSRLKSQKLGDAALLTLQLQQGPLRA